MSEEASSELPHRKIYTKFFVRIGLPAAQGGEDFIRGRYFVVHLK